MQMKKLKITKIKINTKYQAIILRNISKIKMKQ